MSITFHASILLNIYNYYFFKDTLLKCTTPQKRIQIQPEKCIKEGQFCQCQTPAFFLLRFTVNSFLKIFFQMVHYNESALKIQGFI